MLFELFETIQKIAIALDRLMLDTINVLARLLVVEITTL